MSVLISDIAFTPAVKDAQEQRGSRAQYAKMMEKRDWQTEVTADLAAFLATRDSLYLATASGDGRPYIQHRGGPKGFVKVLDPRTLAIADFSGNRQYISLGNLSENDRVHLFFMDYPNRSRIKLWGRARFVENDPGLMAKLVDPAYKARPERALVITVEAWDANCPQHITPRHDETTIELVTAKLTARIRELEAENAELRGWLGKR